MANVNPVSKGTPGWVQPGFMFINDARGNDAWSPLPDTLTNGKIVNSAALIHQVWRFDISAQTGSLVWRSPPSGIVAVASKENSSDTASDVCPTMNSKRQAMLGPIGELGLDLWLHTWRRGSTRRESAGSGTASTPVLERDSVTKLFPAGYCNPNRDNRRAQIPGQFDETTTTGARNIGGSGLRHSVWYFNGITADDEWIRPSRSRQILDCAWQPRQSDISGIDQCNPYITASGRDIHFYGNGANIEGWLHIWTR